jgi:diguanylate cyclase (GGDEF)-like protein/PAS domain S-box-containing protein
VILRRGARVATPPGPGGAADDATVDLRLRADDRFHRVVRRTSDLSALLDREWRFSYVSPSAEALLGVGATDLLGVEALSLVHPDDVERAAGRLAERLAQPARAHVPTPLRLCHRDGSILHVEVLADDLLGDPGAGEILLAVWDVTERVEAEQALRASEERHRALVEHLSDIIVVTDAEGNATYVSPAVDRVLGWSVEESTGSNIFPRMHPDDVHRARRRLVDAVAAGAGLERPERFRYLHADGRWRHLEVTSSNRLDDPAVRGMVYIARDVTHQVDIEERLRHLALHDHLTDLANRTLVRDRLAAALSLGRRQGVATALLVVDLDRFKDVNDGLGHQAGDAVLVELAGRMRHTVRDIDTVGRLGGDEFAAVLPAVRSVEDAVEAAGRIVERVCEPVHHDGRELLLGASVGVAVAPDHGDDVDPLLRRADAAMFRAKAGGLGIVVHDEPGPPGAGREGGG